MRALTAQLATATSAPTNDAIVIGGRDHLANPLWWLTIEFGVEITVMESLNKGGDDFCFLDVGNRISHLGKTSDVAMEKLGRFLINTIQIVLGARPSTRSHVIVGEDLLQLFPRFNGIWGKARELVHGGCHEHDGKIVHHGPSVSSSDAHSSGVSL